MIVFDNVTQAYNTKKGIHTILENLTFTIPAGCKMGILGINGAGKSTLLNLISGAQLPSKGQIIRQGRVSWPLGFAGGFNSDLSGLENCLFVSRIYGRDEKEVTNYVAEFSELGEHFYLPVKSYSSGMRARLSFGLSLAFDFDFYLIDEVIAVGDVRFRAKCRTALQEVHKRAGVILVSHSVSLLREHCECLTVVHDKNVHFFDTIDDGIEFYKQLLRPDIASTLDDADQYNRTVTDVASFA